MFVSNININRIKIIEHYDRKESASDNYKSPRPGHSSHGVEGWPEGRELPVQGGGGDDGGHGAAEDDAHQDAATQGRGPHHPCHTSLVTINTPDMSWVNIDKC